MGKGRCSGVSWLQLRFAGEAATWWMLQLDENASARLEDVHGRERDGMPRCRLLFLTQNARRHQRLPLPAPTTKQTQPFCPNQLPQTKIQDALAHPSRPPPRQERRLLLQCWKFF